jgi:hypothetical protein
VTCDGKPIRKLVFMKGGLRFGNRAVASGRKYLSVLKPAPEIL